MHTEYACAHLTRFQVISSLAQLHAQGVPHAETVVDGAATWIPEGRQQRESVLDELRQRIFVIGNPAEHCWRGVTLRRFCLQTFPDSPRASKPSSEKFALLWV